MKQILNSPFLFIVALLGLMIVFGALFLFSIYFIQPIPSEARTYPGAIAQIGVNNISGSTTQRTLVAHVPTQILATTTCVARTITTTGGDITISFYDGAPTLGQYNGQLQTASTSVTYDSDQFGCGKLKMFAIASSSVTVTETQ